MKFSSFFSNLQEAPWYRSFLNPVIDKVAMGSTVLDIGTGSGKLLQILVKEKHAICTGIDTDKAMLQEAESKLKNTNVRLIKIEPNTTLPFIDNSFDIVTICNVLFHLDNESIDIMLNESQRILDKGGKIIVLTPSGSGSLLTLSKSFFSLKNLGIYIWYRATKNRAKKWMENSYLKQYSIEHNLKYTSESVMKGFAQLEVLQ